MEENTEDLFEGKEVTGSQIRSAFSLAVSPNLGFIAIGGRGVIGVYANPSIKAQHVLGDSTLGQIMQLEWTDDNTTLWSLSRGNLTKWDASRNFSPVWRLNCEQSEEMLAFTISRGDEITLGTNLRVRTFTLPKGDSTTEVTLGSPLPKNHKAILSAHHYVIVNTKRLFIHDQADGVLLLSRGFQEEFRQPPLLSITPNGQLLAVGYPTGSIHIFNLRALRNDPVEFSFQDHTFQRVLKGLCWDPFGNSLIGLSGSGTVMFWNTDGKTAGKIGFQLSDYRYAKGLAIAPYHSQLFFVDDYGTTLFSLPFGIPTKFLLFLRKRKLLRVISGLPPSLLKEMTLY
mmetsp:Transcript_7417/g.8117  ORF Transcript_7417/g.8117 Transcript_7417/m.8117 type:complete len:342 (+) Transcript_7417:37-1062(+)